MAKNQTNKNKNIMLCYEELKALIDQKIMLKQLGKNTSQEYVNTQNNIKELVESLSTKELSQVGIFFDQEYKNQVAIYNSDIEPSMQKRIERKLSIYDEFVEIKQIHSANKQLDKGATH